MIFKSKVGTGVTAALRYVQGPGRDENGRFKQGDRARLLGGQGFGFDPLDARQAEIARRVMEHNGRPEMQGDKKCYCVNDCLHISLSWARGQSPDDAEKREACERFLGALGMKNAQAMFYDHNDKSYSHVHVVASRIDPETGLAYDDYQRMYRGMHQAIEWERDKNQVTKQRQWCHDLADATRGQVDNDRLMELLIKNEATIPKNRVDLALAFGGKFGPYLEAAREAFVKDQDLLRLKKGNSRTLAYTTKEIWKEEAQLLAAARRLKERSGYGIPQDALDKHAKDLTLTQEQREALWHMTRDNGLSMVAGEAGTGKSRTLVAFRKVNESRNRKVRALAFTNKVVQNLARDGFEAATIASQMLRKDLDWDKDTDVVVDEAAQLSTPDLKKLMQRAEKYQAKLTLVGDQRQLGSIELGGLFGVMQRRHGSARLTEVMRNKDPNQKRAFNRMHERKFAEAIDIFRRAGSVQWDDMQPESIKRLTEDYARDYLERPDDRQLMLAATNDEVDRLNHFAQDLRRQAGKLGASMRFDTAHGPTSFAVGDRVSMTETPNPKDKRKGLINGAFGEVKGFHQSEDGKRHLTLAIDRKKGEQPRVFTFPVGMDRDNGETAGVRLGYASTVYKAQGDTLDRTYVLHNQQATAPSNYVALSRHADRTRIYASREDTAGYADLATQLKHGQDKTAAHAYMLDEEDRPKLDEPEQAPQQQRYMTDDPFMQHQLQAKAMAASREPERPRDASMLDKLFGQISGFAAKSHARQRGLDQGQAGRGDLRDETDATKKGIFFNREREMER